MQLAAIQFRLNPRVESCDTFAHHRWRSVPPRLQNLRYLRYILFSTSTEYCQPPSFSLSFPLFLSIKLLIKIWTVLNLDLKSFSKAVHCYLRPTDHLNRRLRYWQTTKMASAPAKYSFAGIANMTCGSSRGKDEFFPLKKCVVEVKNHLISCNLSRTKVTEYDLILARAGKFNLSHEEVEKMVVCPAHRHNLGIYWRPCKSYQYPGHEGKRLLFIVKTQLTGKWRKKSARCLLPLFKSIHVNIFSIVLF